MVVNVPLDDDVFDGLKSIAEPLVDDINSLIRKMTAVYKQSVGATGKVANDAPVTNGSPEFDPAAPPDLLHAVPTKILFDGKLFKPNETYWNTLLIEVIRRAAKAMPKDQVESMVIINHQKGERSDNGFRYIPEADLSVQGQDSVRAWKAIHHVAAQLDVPLEVEFRWQPKPEAAFPGGKGRFRLNV